MESQYNDLSTINLNKNERKVIRKNIPIIFFMCVIIFNIFFILASNELTPLDSLKFILYLNIIGFIIVSSDKLRVYQEEEDVDEKNKDDDYFDIEKDFLFSPPISSVLPRSTYP